MTIQLSDTRIGALSTQVMTPKYDRTSLAAGILHVGLGNFHRAHQAVYYDDLLSRGGDPGWGILGAGVMPADAAMRDGLMAQDFLYTVTEMSNAGEDVRVVGAVAGFLPVVSHHQPMIEAMSDPQIRIVSLTVTEGGYFISAETGGFDPDHPAIRADIDAPDRPSTVFGAIVAGLRARRVAGEAPFTVMSCDNIPHNGNVTRAVILGIADAQDPDLSGWIEENVTFPNGMVDRITPATTDARRAELTARHGIDDARPVFCEPFRQWVLEDRFTAGRPALENVGVEFVEDVTPYEHMKIRMLNGGHSTFAYPSSLLGITFAHEAMAHPLVSAYFDKIESTEIYHVVEAVPGKTPSEYHALLRDRFSNPRIEDTIHRICFDGSNKHPKFIIPTARENLAAGRPVTGIALECALWCRYCQGTDEQGGATQPNDPNWDRLQAHAQAAREDPGKWLSMSDVFGEMAGKEAFANEFSSWLVVVNEDGTEAALQKYLS